MGGAFIRNVFTLSTQGTFLSSQQNEGLIIGKNLRTACPQTWKRGSKRERIQRRGVDPDNRITRKRHKLAETATTLQPSSATVQMTHRPCRSINQRGCNRPINKRCHRGFRSTQAHDPAGVLAAAAAALIGAPHYKGSPSHSSVLAYAQSSSSTRLPALPRTNTLWENADGGKGENKTTKTQLHGRHQCVWCTAVNNYDSFRKIHNPVGLWHHCTLSRHIWCIKLKNYHHHPNANIASLHLINHRNMFAIRFKDKQGCAQKEI